MDLSSLISEAHNTAIEKGWWTEEEHIICTNCNNHQTYGSSCAVCGCIDLATYYQERTFGDQLALIHSEVSEALEEYRKGQAFGDIWFSGPKGSARYGGPLDEEDTRPNKPEGIAVEFADVLIRIFDTCGRYKIPLEEALRLKMAYNKTRPHRHGGKKL